jgi:hypothetical protein
MIYKDGINGYTFTSVNECCKKINKFIHLPKNEQKNIMKNGKRIKKFLIQIFIPYFITKL